MANNNLERIKKKISQINTTNNDFLTGLEDVNTFYINVQKKRLVDLFEMYEEELEKLSNSNTKNVAKKEEYNKPKPTKVKEIKPETIRIVDVKKVETPKPSPTPHPPKAKPKPERIGNRTNKPEYKKYSKTLADKLLNEDRNDLNKKYRNSKVENLSKSIHISKKFEFINNLFKNNAEMYKEVVSAIDQMNNSEEAFVFLETVTVEQFDWSHQEKLAADFYHFVYRRFI